MTEIVDQVVATPSTADEARQRADRIRSGMRVLAEWQNDVITAYAARDWASLGYTSWEAYLDGEFGEHRIRLPRDQRREIVAGMTAASMSTRAIAAAVGVDHKTVVNDRRSGGEFSPPVASPADLPASRPAVRHDLGDVLREVGIDPDELDDDELADEPQPAPAPRPIIGTDGKTYTQPAARPTAKPRTDVVATVNRALLRAQEAARAADEISRQHLAGRKAEASTWGHSLSLSMESLQRLLDILSEDHA